MKKFGRLGGGVAAAACLGTLATTGAAAPGADVSVASTPPIATASSCCGDTQFTVSNASDAGEQITGISIDLAGAALPDLVFDPDDGTPAGDSLSFSFTAGEVPAGATVDAEFPAASAQDDGFRQIAITTTGLGPASQVRFGVDVDPTSARGLAAAPPAESVPGAIAGAELHGALVTVSFSDGSTLSAELVGDLDSTISQAQIRPNMLPEPKVTLASGATGPGAVSGITQTIVVTGPPGAEGRIAIFEGALELGGGAGFDIDPFEANTLRARTVVSTTLDDNGRASAEISLGNVGGDNGGINLISAWIVDGARTGPVAGPVVLQLDPSAPPTLGSAPAAPGGAPAPSPAVKVAGLEFCSGFELARAASKEPGKVTLSSRQLLINQRIGQTAIRRLNAVETWVNEGIFGNDFCGGSLTPNVIGAGLSSGNAPLFVSRAEPRKPRIAARAQGGDKVDLSTRQLKINQRIYRAALLRAKALDTRLRNLTGGDVVDGSIDLGRFAEDVVVAPGVAVGDTPPSRTEVASLKDTGGKFVLSPTQLRTNQRIAQRAVRDSNDLLAKIRRGLLATNFAPDSITAKDLTVPDFRAPTP